MQLPRLHCLQCWLLLLQMWAAAGRDGQGCCGSSCFGRSCLRLARGGPTASSASRRGRASTLLRPLLPLVHTVVSRLVAGGALERAPQPLARVVAGTEGGQGQRVTGGCQGGALPLHAGTPRQPCPTAPSSLPHQNWQSVSGSQRSSGLPGSLGSGGGWPGFWPAAAGGPEMAGLLEGPTGGVAEATAAAAGGGGSTGVAAASAGWLGASPSLATEAWAGGAAPARDGGALG